MLLRRQLREVQLLYYSCLPSNHKPVMFLGKDITLHNQSNGWAVEYKKTTTLPLRRESALLVKKLNFLTSSYGAVILKQV